MFLLAGLMGMIAVGAFAMGGESGDQSTTDPETGEIEPEIEASDQSVDEAGFILPGTDQPDALNGDEGSDRINGYGGDDTIAGQGGDDEIFGDKGNDRILGGDGDDVLHGGDGDDEQSGGAGDDTIIGHNGNDVLIGDAGNDALQGSAGNDHLDGGAGDDSLQGGLDDDTLHGGAGSDTLFGGWGNDVVSGLSEDGTTEQDFVNGGGDDDILLTDQGDIATGGEGADQFYLDAASRIDAPIEVMDYDADEDSMVVVWDVAAQPDPTIELKPDKQDPALTHLFIDDTRVALLHGIDDTTNIDVTLVSPSQFKALALVA